MVVVAVDLVVVFVFVVVVVVVVDVVVLLVLLTGLTKKCIPNYSYVLCIRVIAVCALLLVKFLS